VHRPAKSLECQHSSPSFGGDLAAIPRPGHENQMKNHLIPEGAVSMSTTDTTSTTDTMSSNDTMSTTDELTRVYKWGALTGAVILALATAAALLGQAAGL